MSAPSTHFDRPALIVIDVQQGFDDSEFWGPRDNPACEQNIAALVAHWRNKDWPLVFVQHQSSDPGSPLAMSSPGREFKDVITGTPDLLVRKNVNSSFYGSPDLDSWLRAEGIGQVVICGITTNHCCETTARMAGNLGYDTYFALDATHTFDRRSPDGTTVPAATLSMVTATNLDGEFATVSETRALLESDSSPRSSSVSG
ncbi:cysteine hydrolase family protein [Nesterenkonia lutea]|uniref:Nicotinamidase-related amidase n=1 Tax=Nesterenkonia lutea TaxID=272919 RepID=A0ABR9JHX4_9MICC|nr:cysteine hydrolase family protein [Nesterenkonia lutea]MBE1525390.1 nicotinamidase-related amidase [Nesterenkonia lutea]